MKLNRFSMGAVMMICASTGFGATNSCPTLQTSGNTGYPVTGPNNEVYSSTGLTTFTGCQVVNAVFSNWFTENTFGTYIGSAVSAGQSNDPLVTEPTFRLATERGDFSGGITYQDNNDGNNDWSTASADGNIGGDVDFVVTTTGTGLKEISYVFTGVTHGGGGGTVGITPIFCMGGTVIATSAPMTAADCTSAGGVAYSPGLTNIVGNGTQTLNFFLPQISTRVAIGFEVDLTAGTTSAGFSYLDMSFGETTPEPSTFLLLGSALAGLGFMGWRRSQAR
jgi:hypothetical protein